VSHADDRADHDHDPGGCQVCGHGAHQVAPTVDLPLPDQPCVPRREGSPLDALGIAPLLAQLPNWTVVNDHHLFRRVELADFAQALAVVNLVGAQAEAVQHHPELRVGWGRVEIELYTHDLDGLCHADFVLAARFDRALAALLEAFG
jgi:4a-hydroxytetrahydrobiopterin dehydratase